MKEYLFKNRYLCLYVCFLMCIFIAYNFSCELNSGDAEFFSKQIFDLSYIQNRYKTWTSRIFIEYFVVFFCHHHILFRILNLCLIFPIYISIAYLLNFRSVYSILIVIIGCFCYHFQDMESAGIIPTCLNYWWPLASMFGMLTFFKMYIKSGKEYFYYLCFPSGMLAANSEQFCIALFMIFSIYAIRIYIDKKVVSNKVLLLLLFLLLSLLFILTCPGNYARYAANISYWYPDWPQLNFFEKTYNGLVFIGKRYFFSWNTIMPFFSLVLLATLVRQEKLKIFMLFPIIIQFFCPFKSEFPSFIIFFISASIVIIQIISINIVILSNYNRIIVFVLLFIGIISRMVLTYSPTVYASSMRTFIIMDFSLLISALLIWNIVMKLRNNFCLVCLIALSFFQQISLLFSIL